MLPIFYKQKAGDKEGIYIGRTPQGRSLFQYPQENF